MKQDTCITTGRHCDGIARHLFSSTATVKRGLDTIISDAPRLEGRDISIPLQQHGQLLTLDLEIRDPGYKSSATTTGRASEPGSNVREWPPGKPGGVSSTTRYKDESKQKDGRKMVAGQERETSPSPEDRQRHTTEVSTTRSASPHVSYTKDRRVRLCLRL